MTAFILMVIVFILGYMAIALEHPIKVDKAASALFIGSFTWVVYILGGFDILDLGFSRAWNEFKATIPEGMLFSSILIRIMEDPVLHAGPEISGYARRNVNPCHRQPLCGGAPEPCSRKQDIYSCIRNNFFSMVPGLMQIIFYTGFQDFINENLENLYQQ